MSWGGLPVRLLKGKYKCHGVVFLSDYLRIDSYVMGVVCLSDHSRIQLSSV